MKRSEINQYIREAKAFMTKYHFMLPPWADWTPDDWKSKGLECNDIRERAMGWDLTDFGWGDFLKIGLTLVTLRNGSLQKKDKPYCEKIMFVRCGPSYSHPFPLAENGRHHQPGWRNPLHASVEGRQGN